MRIVTVSHRARVEHEFCLCKFVESTRVEGINQVEGVVYHPECDGTGNAGARV
jgi:hypothetical protein